MSDLERAEAVLREAVGDRVRRGFPLAPMTTFRVGGAAALFLEAESEDDLAAAGRAVAAGSVPIVVIGKGSNILVSDDGFPGLVVRLGRSFRWAAREGSDLVAGGAEPLPALAGVALSHRLAGIEFGVAIPASVGGAVRMNAGAHGRSMSDVVSGVEIYSMPGGAKRWIRGADAGFAYRRSGFGDGDVVIGARVTLAPDDRDAIRARMDEAREWRRRTQPLAQPNCGSVFTNPEGDHAARLVEAAGAKGLRVGGAEVSAKHANFIVADPEAKARDVAELIRMVQDRVAQRFGVTLETEVRLVGTFAEATS